MERKYKLRRLTDDSIFPFGANKGRRIGDLGVLYFEWLETQDWFMVEGKYQDIKNYIYEKRLGENLSQNEDATGMFTKPTPKQVAPPKTPQVSLAPKSNTIEIKYPPMNPEQAAVQIQTVANLFHALRKDIDIGTCILLAAKGQLNAENSVSLSVLPAAVLKQLVLL